MMEKMFVAIAVAAVGVASASQGAVSIEAGKTDVVLVADVPEATRLAAVEMTNLLSKVLGAAVPLTCAPAPGRTAVVVGDNELSRKAGIDVSSMKRDEFAGKVLDGKVFIAGRDDSRKKLPPAKATAYLRREAIWQNQFERATLFGVYAFLERYAGCRFYFPGELGTVLPRKAAISVEGDFSSAPDFTVRRYGYGDGKVPDAVLAGFGGDAEAFKRANFNRLRMETEYIPCCHGLNKFRYMKRFGNSHPEYFSLFSTGKRDNDVGRMGHVGHICYSSGVVEEIYQDVKAYLSGQPASSRGLSSWGKNVNGEYVDIMSQDGMGKCHCAGCQSRYDNSLGPNYATEFIWSNTVAIANRLTSEGIKGTLTQMAYRPYRRPPVTVDIPSNVIVMVAENGPWSFRDMDRRTADDAEIRSWTSKLGRKVWLWTYPLKTVGFAGVPQMAPRTWGRYFKFEAPHVFGAFAESESDIWLYNYLNYYVFSRVCWDNSTDVDAVVDEHHRLMFGAAADDMKRFYDELEEVWTARVVGKFADTPLGPKLAPPDAVTLWNDIYSAERLDSWKGLFDSASSKVASDSVEARRVSLFRTEFLDRLIGKREEFFSRRKKLAELALPADGRSQVSLRPFPCKGKMPNPAVGAKVSIRIEGNNLVVSYECEEPHMANRMLTENLTGENGVPGDDGIEFFLVPCADGKIAYEFFVTSAGRLADAKGTRNGTRMARDFSWNSGATAVVRDIPGGYGVEARIPLSVLGKIEEPFRANFCRNRILHGRPGSGWYVWGPYVTGYPDVDNFGRIVLDNAGGCHILKGAK